MRVEGLGALDDAGGQLGVQLFEEGLGEAGADVANSFEAFARGVVAGKQEGAVDGGAFAPAEIGAYDDEVERVANAGQVVLFHFEPVAAALAGLVAAVGRVEHLDHEALT